MRLASLPTLFLVDKVDIDCPPEKQEEKSGRTGQSSQSSPNRFLLHSNWSFSCRGAGADACQPEGGAVSSIPSSAGAECGWIVAPDPSPSGRWIPLPEKG